MTAVNALLMAELTAPCVRQDSQVINHQITNKYPTCLRNHVLQKSIAKGGTENKMPMTVGTISCGKFVKSDLYIRWMYHTKNKTSPSKSKGEAKCCGGLGKEETQHRQKLPVTAFSIIAAPVGGGC